MELIFYYKLAGFALEYFAAIMIFIFGLNTTLEGRKSENEIQKQYNTGLGLFFISVASASLIYLIDLVRSALIDGKRVFPRDSTYHEMGFDFVSFHHQFYFIILISFVLICLYFLMKPVEKYMQQKENTPLSKICLALSPLPYIIRILELEFLPQAGSIAYYIFTALFILLWLVIGISVLTVLGLYLKVVSNSTGDVRKKSLFVVIGIIVWLITFFMRATFLKTVIEDAPYLFWLLPGIEFFMLFLFDRGFAQNLGQEPVAGEHNYIYNNWFFKTFIVGIVLTIGIYLQIFLALPGDGYLENIAEVSFEYPLDLVFVRDWSSAAASDPFWSQYALFFDESMFELIFDDFDEYIANGLVIYAQDIVFLFLGVCILLYLFHDKSRKYTGFVIVSAIVLAIVNRMFKAFFARVRPGGVIDGSTFNYNLFSQAWMMGHYPLDEAFSTGSFTSGHTTTALMLITIAFILIKTHKTWLILLGFGGTITFSVMMGFGRIYSRDHYPSDTLWAVIVGLALVTWVYFMVLKIPEQEDGEFVIRDKFAELKWGILFVFFAVFILVALLGIKYTILEFEWYWPIAIVVGPILAWFLWKRMNSLLYGTPTQKVSEKEA